MESLLMKPPVMVLQELLTGCGTVPIYEPVPVQGRTRKSKPLFRYRVRVARLDAWGTGESKKEAKHAAAKALLAKLTGASPADHDTDSDDPETPTQSEINHDLHLFMDIEAPNPLYKTDFRSVVMRTLEDRLRGERKRWLKKLCKLRSWQPSCSYAETVQRRKPKNLARRLGQIKTEQVQQDSSPESSQSDKESDAGSPANEIIWDDALITSAYAKAVDIKLENNIAASTNTSCEEDITTQLEEQDTKASESGTKMKWAEGEACRAVYEGDGEEYEAIVHRVIDDKECVIRFIGYGDKQIVSVDDMKPSRGVDAQQRQIEHVEMMGVEENDEDLLEGMDTDSDTDSESGPSCESMDRSAQRKSKKKKIKRVSLPVPMSSLGNVLNLSGMNIPFPSQVPFCSTEHMDSEDQSLSSMLISYFMSGYYTGAYQGLKRLQHHKKRK